MPPGSTTIRTADGSISSRVQSGVTRDAVRARDRPRLQPRDRDLLARPAEDVDDRDGLDLLESRGERHDDGSLLHGELRN